ncbi:hypothetical protein [Peptostreptococcus porci]|uniref:hypothetical protein n=1 Tax=Peptostreptococcus porci TaxID=2652282 RepID=UPI002A81AE5E|nr:hypothetical protein [Peptostreptococcus porci]MDY4128699.1 hypothetical protein [Peptostreptococcus porci]
MFRIVEIEGRQIPLRVNGSFLLRYKAEFKRDGLLDIFSLFESVSDIDFDNIENIENDISLSVRLLKNIDTDLFYSMFYMMAKTADIKIKDDIYTWLDQFENIPILDLFVPVINLLMDSIKSTTQKKTMTNYSKKKRKGKKKN